MFGVERLARRTRPQRNIDLEPSGGSIFLQRVRGHKFARDACAMDARNQYNRFNDSTAGSKGEHYFTVSCLDTNTGLESPLPNR